MSIPTPDFLLCPICRTRFNGTTKKPISLLCGHTCCSSCLQLMHRKQCPLDATPFQQEDIDSFPTNQALLLLVTENKTEENTTKALQNGDDSKNDEKVVGTCIGELALYLKPLSSGNQKTGNSITLSRPMQRKLVALVHCQLAEPVGRARALRAARSLGERTCTELILQHQNQQQLSSMLWAAVRTRGCQFLGPAMQEAALKYILLSLEQGEALSRKVLVLYVVQQLEPHFPQASKTSIGHVVQLLYRASCFKVAKRNDESSLMQLKEEYRTYEALRREHDAQIVNMAQEAGIRIPPDQWSQLLYGDTAHKSHMQSIIDRLQTPASFTQSIQELMIALSRTEDTHNLSGLSNDFNTLAAINPATEDSSVTWSQLKVALIALRNVVKGLERFLQAKAKVKGLTEHTAGCLHDNCNAHGKYKTTMCRDLLLPQSCPRGASCTFAHTQDEMERYRSQKKNMKNMSEAEHSATCSMNSSPSVSSMQASLPPAGSPVVSQQQPMSQQLKGSPHHVPQPHVPQGMLPPPPPAYPPQNMPGLPPTNGHHLPTSRPWNGNVLTPDPRLATPRLPGYQQMAGPHRQLDHETLQLLQLKQQLLQQGVQTPLPPPPAAPLPSSLHNLTTEQLLSHATNQFSSVPTSRSNGLTGDYNFGTVPNVTNIDTLSQRLHMSQQQQHAPPPPPPVSSASRQEAQIPLWDQPKINGLTNAASATPVSGAQGTPNLWGGQYDPIVSQLNGYDEALLRQELLKQYSQLSLASTPGLTSNLLNQLQAQQHAQQQHAAASPSPALPSFPNYDATNILASRLNQLRLSQQLGNPATSTGYQTNPTESLSNGLNGYDRLIPQASTPTVQQIKYELAKAEKYEQLLNSGLSNSALLSQLHSSGLTNGLSNGQLNGLSNGQLNGLSNGQINGLSNGQLNGLSNGLSNGQLNGLSNGLSNGQLNGLSNGLSNGLHGGLNNGLSNDFAKSASQINPSATPMDQYSNAATPSIWQNDSSWHSFLSSRPTSVALGSHSSHGSLQMNSGGHNSHAGGDDMNASIQQLLQHYTDRNLAFQFQLDDVE